MILIYDLYSPRVSKFVIFVVNSGCCVVMLRDGI